MNWHSIKQSKIKIFLSSLVFLFIFLPLIVWAGNAFSPLGVVYINTGGVKSNGIATSENSKATAISYRDGIVGQSMITDQPGPHIIFAADGEYPAYTMWDVGSSAWKTPQAAGQDMYLVLETYSGMNGWTGNSYVGGSHKVLTLADIGDAAATPPDIIMEPISTPVMGSKTETSLTIQFPGLKDRSDTGSGGTWNNSIVGYTIYRSVNNTSNPVKIGTVNQSANGGGTISYTDSTVTQGVSYYYRLGVNYRWSVNTPNPWYETVAKGPWSASLATGSVPNAVKFVAGPITANATVKTGPITISSYNFALGDISSVTAPVTMNLSSNSTGQGKFYAYNGSVCDNTPVTSITMPIATSSISFCYSDTLAGVWSVTATPTNTWSAITQANQVINIGPLDHFTVDLAATQKNALDFTGINTITAKDAGENIITGFSAQNNSVVMSASNGATLTNTNLTPSDFVNGVSNLTAKNFKYTGLAGNITFTATSQNSKIGSDVVTIQPGNLNSVSLRDTVGGAGAIINTRTMTTDSTFSLFAAGYDISNNYISDISGTWGVTGTLNNNFVSNSSSVIFAPTTAPTTGTITFTDGATHNANTSLITVNSGVIHHFEFNLTSPQLTTVNFTGVNNIIAKDLYNNTVTNYNSTGNNVTLTTVVAGATLKNNVLLPTDFTNGIASLTNKNFSYTGLIGNVTLTATSAVTNKIGSGSVLIEAGPLDHFTVDLAATQKNALDFTGINTITAKDAGENIITGFSAQNNSVVMSASNGATLTNTNLTPSDFVNGVSNLTAKNFKYTGLAGNITFTATSQNSKIGSDVVTIQPGNLNSVSLRDTVGGAGAIINTRTMTTDSTFSLFAAGYDISNNYISDISGTWGVTGTLNNNFVSNSSSVIFAPTTAPTTGTITFTDGATHNANTSLITVNSGVLASFSMPTNIPDQIAGTAFSFGPIRALDAHGNTVSNYSATVTLADTTTTITPKTSSVFSGGQLNSQSVIITKAQGSVVITVTASGKSASSNAFNVSSGTLHHFQLNLISPQVNDKIWTGVNSVIAQDQWNNIISNYNSTGTNVALTANNAAVLQNNILTASDFINGVADISLKNIKYTGQKGSVIFTATSIDTNKTGTSTITISAGDIKSVLIRNAANNGGIEQGVYNMEVGQNLVLYAASYDISSNYIGEVTGLWGRTGTLDDPASGLVNSINYRPLTAYSNGVITFDDSNGHTDQTGVISVNRGALHHFEVSLVSPQLDGVVFSGANNIIAKDLGNNTITDYNLVGNDVTINTTVPGATLKNNIFNKDKFIAGVANLSSNNFSYTGLVGNVTLNVVSVVTNKTGSSVVLINPGPLDHFDFSLTSGQLINVPFTGVNTIIARDIGNNIITNFNALVDNVTLTFSPSSNSVNKPTGLGGPEENVLLRSEDFVNGVSSLTGRLKHPGAGGGYVFTATSTSGKTGVSNNTDIDVGPLHHFGFEVIDNQQAGQNFGIIVKAYAQDPDGFSHVKVSYNGSVTLTDGSKTVMPTVVGPFINGQASANIVITKAMIGNVLRAKDSVQTSIIGDSNAFNVSGGALHHFTFVSNINNQVAGVAFDLGQVEARDQWENVTETFNESPSIIDVTGTLNINNTNNFVNGVLANERGIITKVRSGNKLTLNFEGKTGSSSLFTVNVGPVAKIIISEQAGGLGVPMGERLMSTDDSLTLFAVGYDAYDNYNKEVPGSWTKDGSLSEVPSGSLSTIVFNPTISGSSGHIIFTDSAYHTANTGVISVKHGNLATFSVNINSPQQVGVVLSAGASVVAKDAKGNIVSDFNAATNNVSFIASSGGRILGLGTGNNNILNNATSFVNGSADLSALKFMYAGIAGTINIAAVSASGRSGNSGPVLFNVGVLDHFNLNLYSLQKNGLYFNGINNIKAIDLGENVLTNYNASLDPVTITVNPADGVLAGDKLDAIDSFNNGESNLTGKFAFTGKKGSHTFTARSLSGKIGVAEVEILPGQLAYIQIRNASGGNGGIVGSQTLKAGDTFSMWAAGYDTSDNFIQDQTVSWIGTGVVASYLNPVNAVKTIFSATIPGTGVIHASSNDIHAETGTITVQTGLIAKLAFLSDPYDGDYQKTPPPPRSHNAPIIASKISGPIVVQAQDIVGNVVVLQEDLNFNPESVGSLGLNGEFSISTTTWINASSLNIKMGQSETTVFYKNNNAGDYTINMIPANNDLLSATQPLVVSPIYDTSLVFTSPVQTIKAGEMSAKISLSLKNVAGEDVTLPDMIPVSLVSNSPGLRKFYFDAEGSAEITSINIPADKNSVSFYYKDTAVTRSLITARAAGLTDAYQLINISAGDPKRLFITPGATAIDGQKIIQNYSSEKITIQVLDDYGNLVPMTSATTIHLSSANTTGAFAGTDTNGTWQTSVINPVAIIPIGKSEAFIYYRDSTLGEVKITASVKPENNWEDATQIETIYASVITKLAFITPERKMDTNVTSSVITIQTQDAVGDAMVVSQDTVISLITSDSANGKFAIAPAGPWGITQATIPAGQSSVNFYYKDAIPGKKNIGVSENPTADWSDAVQKITINAGVVAKINFTTPEQTIAKNTSSNIIKVELQDNRGYATTYASDVLVNISSNSANGAFAINNLAGPWNVVQVKILAGESEALFYYRNTQPGTYVLNAATQAPLSFSTQQTIAVTQGVVSRLNFITESQSIATSTASKIITIQAQNDQGNPVEVLSDTTINLTTNSSSGQFALLPSSTWGINSIVMPAGQNSVSLYYKDATSGTYILNAKENPNYGWLAGSQQIIIGSIENTITKLKFISAAQVGDRAIFGGEISSKITVQTRSILDNPVPVSQTTYLVVTSSHQSGQFANINTGNFSNSIVLTLLPGQTNADFYYTDTIQGLSNLTVSEFPSIGWMDDTQAIEIKAGNISELAFVTPVQTLLTNNYSQAITIQTREIYGNAKKVDVDTKINIVSNSGTGKFYATANSVTPINNIIIPANSDNITVYYKDSMAGTYIISADEEPDQSWLMASQSIVVTEPTLSSLVIKPSYALMPTNTNVQFTAIVYNSLGNPIANMPITWNSTSQAAGSISSEGVLVTKKNIGVYTDVIEATVGNLKAQATVEVYEKPVEVINTTTTITVPGGGGGGGVVYVEVPVKPVDPILPSNPDTTLNLKPGNALAFINNEAVETDKQIVNLGLYATGASYMKISEKQNFEKENWLDYKTNYEYKLSDGFGQKTIYVKFQSANNYESETIVLHINFVKKVNVKIPDNTSVSQQVIKKYNYIILNQQQEQAPILPQVLSPAPNSFVLSDALTITGSALPDTIVTLHIHSARAITVKVITDSSGYFTYNLNEARLEEGDHKIYASVESKQGSLIGPAINFGVTNNKVYNVYNSELSLDELNQQVKNLNTKVRWLMFGWLLAVNVLLLVFYGWFTGYLIPLRQWPNIIIKWWKRRHK